jgi:hypothetical protein
MQKKKKNSWLSFLSLSSKEEGQEQNHQAPKIFLPILVFSAGPISPNPNSLQRKKKKNRRER